MRIELVSPSLRRSANVALAAGATLNDEATLLLSAAEEAATDDDDQRTCDALADIRASAQRCAWLAATLLRHGRDNGGLRSTATVERIAETPTL